MNARDEHEFYALAVELERTARGPGGWAASQYSAIGSIVEHMTEFVATCDCQVRRNREKASRDRHERQDV